MSSSAPKRPEPPEPAQQLSLTLAAKASGVSEVTLRKQIKAGRLEAAKVHGQWGQTWAIDLEKLAEFVQGRYGHGLGGTKVAAQGGPSTDTVGDLRRRYEDALQELGKQKALVTAKENTAIEVERVLKEHMDELRAERDAATAELERLRARRFWGRVFGR